MRVNPTLPESEVMPYCPVARVAEGNFFQTGVPLLFTLIDAESAATPTVSTIDYIDVLGRNLHAVQVTASQGTVYNATVLVEGTLDGTNWSTIESITQPGIYQFTGLYQSLRASIPTYTSGTITTTAITQRT